MNARNCLGCVPLMYAAGSGHVEVTKLLLSQPAICVNIRNNDRLTTFMLAMQVCAGHHIIDAEIIVTLCAPRLGGMLLDGLTVEVVAVDRSS